MRATLNDGQMDDRAINLKCHRDPAVNINLKVLFRKDIKASLSATSKRLRNGENTEINAVTGFSEACV